MRALPLQMLFGSVWEHGIYDKITWLGLHVEDCVLGVAWLAITATHLTKLDMATSCAML